MRYYKPVLSGSRRRRRRPRRVDGAPLQLLLHTPWTTEPASAQTGRHRSSDPRIHRHGPPKTPRGTCKSSSSSRSAARRRDPEETSSAREAKSAGKSKPSRRSSGDRRRRRGKGSTQTPATAAPPPPQRRRPEPYRNLDYVQAGIRGFPTLPPPRRPPEEGESRESPASELDRRGASKIASLYCRGGDRSKVRSFTICTFFFLLELT